MFSTIFFINNSINKVNCLIVSSIVLTLFSIILVYSSNWYIELVPDGVTGNKRLLLINKYLVLNQILLFVELLGTYTN